uniref:Uncharacterized protein n=1 Tax=Ditylenchus dipsaci TaxID=166011 RepID=A0A915CY79_9BILA
MSDPVMQIAEPMASIAETVGQEANGEEILASTSTSAESCCESPVSSTCIQQSNTKEASWELADPDGQLSHKWKKPSESMMLVQHFLGQGLTPKEVLNTLLPATPYPLL